MYSREDFEGLLEQSSSSGKWIRGLCPFHDDVDPSLYVYDDGFYCFGCKASGPLDLLYDALAGVVPGSWVIKRLDRKYRSFERVNWPRENFGDYCNLRHIGLLQLTQVHWYLEDRGIESLIKDCQLGWDNGWYIIPVRDRSFKSHWTRETIVQDGDIIGAVARACPATARKTGMRYDMPADQKPTMYIPSPHLCRSEPVLYVVYGMIDALAMTTMGYACVTTTAGQQSFRPEWLDHWSKPIRIIPDKGEEEAAYKLAAHLDWRGRTVHLPYDSQCKDPCDFLQYGRKEELIKVVEQSQ